MAIKKRPEAEKLPVSQRIDNRLDNPRRRRMTPTEWEIKGELFMNCSCEVVCPCGISLGKHPPTYGYCQTWFALQIDEGHFEGEDLSGLNCALLIDIPGRMAEGGWRVAAYVDDSASGKAYNGLLQILSGTAGGNTGVFNFLVSEIIGAEREKVLIERDGRRRKITVGRKIRGEIEMIPGKNPDVPVSMENTQYWMGPTIYPAVGLKSKVMDYGWVWDFEGKSADIIPIHWTGPGRV
ncbi:DUF1326 domain-containing protein [Shimia biformata]|uniref:DUF1326 domain-containing protein n=1 Tax=Shimia biformata TaxID=1294299 RepID=UPI00194EAEE2|nr:DUF1326 domain-containing protein [Shimia biformata]